MEGSGYVPDVFLDPEPNQQYFLMDWTGSWEVGTEQVEADSQVPSFWTFRKSLFKIFSKKQSCEIKGQQLIEALEIWGENWK